MQSPSWLLQLLCVFGLLALSLADVSFESTFDAAPGTMAGGCDAHRAALDQWFDECYDLADRTVNALTLDNYANSLPLQKALAVYFGIKPNSAGDKPSPINNWNQVVQFYEAAANFYNNEPNQPFNGKPQVFCNSDYLQLKSPQDDALDSDGDIIPDDEGNPRTIADVYKTNLAKPRNKPQPVPWYATSLKIYDFAPEADAGGNYCTNSEHLGLTVERSDGALTVTICPAAFNLATALDTIGGRQVTPDDNLEFYVPKSGTLFHETFHIVAGEAMLAGDSETYTAQPCQDLGINQGAQARKNPDSYLYFALTAYYLYEGLWDFSSGVAEEIPPPSR